MATYTENYNFILPETTDVYDVENCNTNFERLDMELAALENQIETLSNTPTSVIKSVQHVVHQIPSDSTESVCGINSVDPTKCIVVFERLEDGTTTAAAKIRYTLNSTSISLKHASRSSSYTVVVGFWIVEFN